MNRKFSKTEIVSDGENIIKEKIFNRRSFIIIIAQIIGAMVIAGKLIKLQVFSKKKYTFLANQNQYRPNFIIPERGKILDRQKKILAYDKMSYHLVVEPIQFKNIEKIIRSTSYLLNNKNRPKDIESFIKKIKIKIKQNPFGRIPIWKNLKKEEINRIEYIAYQLPDFKIENQSTRIYPFKDLISSTLGYLAQGNVKVESKRRGVMLRLINQNHKEGKSGIEKTKNNILSGKIGLEIEKVDAIGNIVNKKIHTVEQDGKDVQLTIDINLQEVAFDAIGNKDGSASLIDLETGELLVSTSLPSFNPQIFDKDINSELWSSIESKKHSFTNKNLTIPYSPGSTFKVVSALNALHHGYSYKEVFNCKGTFKVGSRIFHCHKKEGHGKINLVEAISRSCNCYLYHLGTMTDIDELHNTALSLGLGQQYNVGGMQSNAGIVPNYEWKRKRFGKKWLLGETLNTVIGQGYTECTTLQLAVLASRIASGVNIEPTIIKSAIKQRKVLPFKNEHLKIIQDSMYAAFTDKQGSCRFYLNSNKEYQIAGKTGTAQVISKRIDMKDIIANKINYKFWPHALFIGYAPYNNPRFGIAVVLEHGKSGSAAIPIASKITKAAIDKYIKMI